MPLSDYKSWPLKPSHTLEAPQGILMLSHFPTRGQGLSGPWANARKISRMYELTSHSSNIETFSSQFDIGVSFGDPVLTSLKSF